MFNLSRTGILILSLNFQFQLSTITKSNSGIDSTQNRNLIFRLSLSMRLYDTKTNFNQQYLEAHKTHKNKTNTNESKTKPFDPQMSHICDTTVAISQG